MTDQNPSDPRELENAYYQMTKQLIAAAIPKDIVP